MEQILLSAISVFKEIITLMVKKITIFMVGLNYYIYGSNMLQLWWCWLLHLWENLTTFMAKRYVIYGGYYIYSYYYI